MNLSVKNWIITKIEIFPSIKNITADNALPRESLYAAIKFSSTRD